MATSNARVSYRTYKERLYIIFFNVLLVINLSIRPQGTSVTISEKTVVTVLLFLYFKHSVL